jgi:hypothetical protein
MNDIILNKMSLYRYLGEQVKVYRDPAYTTEEEIQILFES